MQFGIGTDGRIYTVDGEGEIIEARGRRPDDDRRHRDLRGSPAVSNGTHGNHAEDRASMMRAYDQLPPAVRELVRNSMNQWACRPILAWFRKGMTVQAILAHLTDADMDWVRKDARKDWPGQHAAYLAAQPPRRRRDWLDGSTARRESRL